MKEIEMKKMIHENTLIELLIEDKEILNEDSIAVRDFLGKVSAYVSNAFSKLTAGKIKTAKETQNDIKLRKLVNECSFWKHMTKRWIREGNITKDTAILYPNMSAMEEIVKNYKEKHKDDPDIDELVPDSDLMNAAHLIATMHFTNQYEFGEELLTAIAEIGGSGQTSTSKIMGAAGALMGVGILGAAAGAIFPVLMTYLALASAVSIFAADGAEQIHEGLVERLVKIVSEKIIDTNFDGIVDNDELKAGAALQFGSREIVDATKKSFIKCWTDYEEYLIDSLLANPYKPPTVAESNTMLRNIFTEVFHPTLFAFETGRLPRSYEEETYYKQQNIQKLRQMGLDEDQPGKKIKAVEDYAKQKEDKEKYDSIADRLGKITPEMEV